MEHYDPEILAEFLAEANEELSGAESMVVRLDGASPSEMRQVLDGLFRHLHTIKSSSGYFDFEQLTELAHVIESALDQLRGHGLDYSPSIGDLLLAGIDKMRYLLGKVKSQAYGEHDHAAVELVITKFRNVSSGTLAKKQAAFDLLIQASALLNEESNAYAVLQDLCRTLSSEVPGLTGQRAEGDAMTTNGNAEGRGTGEAFAPAMATSEPHAETKTIRIAEHRLDQFLEHVGNMVRLRHFVMSIERLLSKHVSENAVMLQVHDMATSFVKESERLQGSVMALRQVEVGAVLRRLPRIARDVARSIGKEIRVELHGESIEVDKSLIETLENPLVHMIRNAVDHGVESPEVRRAAGKPEIGKIAIFVEEAQDNLMIRVEDDGRGVNRQNVLRKAKSAGIVDDRASLSDEEILALIFAPGFSTSEQVTEVSGRGVGMDVVRQRVTAQGGAIEIHSIEGKGSTFTLRIPRSVNTAIAPAVVVRVGEHWLGVPMKRVGEVLSVDADRRQLIEKVPGGYVLRLRSQVIPLLDLGPILHAEREIVELNVRGPFAVVIAESERGKFGIVVDAVDDVMDVVTQQVDFLAHQQSLFCDACLFGDGKIAMMLDIEALIRAADLHLTLPVPTSLAVDRKSVEKSRPNESFLLFEPAKNQVQAVRMQDVFRLECIERSRIECVGGQSCMRYNGEILPLLSGAHWRDSQEDAVFVVIFAQAQSRVGFLVHRIVDVVMSSPNLDESLLRGAHLHGKGVELAVLRGQIVEILDVAPILRRGMAWQGECLQQPALAA
jgi:two-component system chemotaxis sensor kinase CheA